MSGRISMAIRVGNGKPVYRKFKLRCYDKSFLRSLTRAEREEFLQKLADEMYIELHRDVQLESWLELAIERNDV